MSKQPTLKPGQKSDISGQYELEGPKGGRLGREATIIKHKPAPPTPGPGMKWALVDKTKHKRG